MSLARVWRQQLLGAWSIALMVPAAMLAAVVALALGGGFSQVGVLGQIFAGPSAPSPTGLTGGRLGAAQASASALPVIPAAVGVGRARSGSVRGGRPRGAAPVSSGAPTRAGGAIGGAAPIVTQGAGAAPPRPNPALPAPESSAPTQPQPQPQPTPVDTAVKVVTSVTQQVPAPVGPVATKAVQAAGSAADGVLSPAGTPLPSVLP
jgi:hypothetical protein